MAKRERRAGSVTDTLPDTLAGYDLANADALGRGAMGIVLKAHNADQSRTAALKVKPILKEDNPGMVERIVRDAEAMTALKHKNILRCYESGREGEYLYLALEYMEGDNVTELLEEQGGQLGEQRALEILYDCAVGLQAVEDAGFVHRDIKPRSIFISESGEAKLSDISLGIRYEDDEAIGTSGTVGGAAAYISPEQARGGIRLDIRSDIYALGATCYSMLTGNTPFVGETSAALKESIVNDEPVSVKKTNSDVSDKAAAIIKKCMQKNPDRRYQQTEELVIAIEEAMYGHKRPVTKKISRPKGDQKTRADDEPDVNTPNPLIIFGVIILLAVVIYLIVHFTGS